MNAEQYLERIENKRLNGTPLYSRKVMIDFAEKYVKQLILSGVIPSACKFYMSGMDTSSKCNNCGKPEHLHQV